MAVASMNHGFVFVALVNAAAASLNFGLFADERSPWNLCFAVFSSFIALFFIVGAVSS